MRKSLFLLILVPFILSLMIGSVSCGTQKVYPSDDCDVDKSAPDYCWDTFWLDVRNHSVLEFRSWLKFSVPSGLTIEKAELYLYLNSLAFPDYTNITVQGSANTTWTEETITWNNQPSYNASFLDSKIVYADEIWYSWDVTANVTSGSTSTFVMIAVTYHPMACFDDKEHDNSPYLKLTLAEGEGEEEGADITIMNLPYQFGLKLGISEWSSGMILSALFLFPFNMILLLWKKTGIVPLIINFAILGIFTGIGWLPTWTIILIGLAVIAVSGLKIKDVL